MIFKIKKIIFNKKTFIFASLFYVFFKCMFSNKGQFLTYFFIIYSFITFLLYFIDLCKSKINIFSDILFISSFLLILSGFVPSFYRGVEDFRYFMIFNSILFINLFMFLQFFRCMSSNEIIKKYYLICTIVFFYTLLYSIINIFIIVFRLHINVFGAEWGFDKDFRFHTCINANMIAWLQGLGIGCSICMILIKKYRLLPYINIILSIIIIYFTQSKSTLIGIFFALFFIVILHEKKKNQLKRFILPLILFLLLFCLILLVIIKYKLIRIRLFETGSNFIRIDIINYGLYVLKNVGVLFGSGFGNLVQDWGKYNTEINNSGILLTNSLTKDSELVLLANAHNVFFQHLFNNGIIGLVLLCWLYLYIFYNYIKIILKVNSFTEDKMKFIYVITYFLFFTFCISNFGMNTLYTITQLSCIFFFITSSAICSFK